MRRLSPYLRELAVPTLGIITLMIFVYQMR
jgi:hypothetical protein